jgi:hypothetical protein
MMLRSYTAAAISLAAVLSACQVILGLGHELEVPPPADAGVPEHCAFGVAPPPRPNSPDGQDLQTLVFSMTSQGGTGSGAPTGLDIDGVCTCDSRDRSAHGGLPSCKAPAGNGCDEDGGVDDALGLMKDTLAPLGSLLVGDVGRQSDCGRLSLLVALTEYNGLANDPDVQVSVFPSPGIWDPHSDGEVDASACREAKGSGPHPFPARHDGTDSWSARASDFGGGQAKHNLGKRGYVNDYRLVVDGRFSDDLIESVFSSSLVTIASPSLTARLVPLDGGNASFTLVDATLTGRVATEQVLGALCTHPLYPAVRSSACGSQDMVLPPTQDFSGAGCNALSFVFQFQAEPASVGGVRDFAPDAGACPPATTTCP